MTDEPDDGGLAISKAELVTADEVAEFEKNLRQLIRFRSPFDKHMKALDDMLTERELKAKKPGYE